MDWLAANYKLEMREDLNDFASSILSFDELESASFFLSFLVTQNRGSMREYSLDRRDKKGERDWEGFNDTTR